MSRGKGRACAVFGCTTPATTDVMLTRECETPVSIHDWRPDDGEPVEAGLRVCNKHAGELGKVEDISAPGEPICVVVWVDVELAAGWRLVSELVSSGSYERLVLYAPGTFPS